MSHVRGAEGVSGQSSPSEHTAWRRARKGTWWKERRKGRRMAGWKEGEREEGDGKGGGEQGSLEEVTIYSTLETFYRRQTPFRIWTAELQY